MTNDIGFDLSELTSSSVGYPITFPYPGGWAMSEEACRLLGTFVRWVRPHRVLEFGSGFSSVVIASELARNQTGRLVSIDNSPRWSQAARDMTQKQGFLERVEFHCFPLGVRVYHAVPCVCYKIPSTFYERRGLYDFVVVDGPHVDVGRDGALFEGFSRLKVGSYMLLDDCKASFMKRMLAKWSALFRDSIVYAQALDIGNGITIIRKLQDLPTARRSLPLHTWVIEWLRTARNLFRVYWLGLNAG